MVSRKLRLAEELAKRCMEKRDSYKVIKSRRLHLRSVQDAREVEIEDQGMFFVRKLRNRVKPFLTWEEEYYIDMRTVKRCSKRRDRIKSIAKRRYYSMKAYNYE